MAANPQHLETNPAGMESNTNGEDEIKDKIAESSVTRDGIGDVMETSEKSQSNENTTESTCETHPGLPDEIPGGSDEISAGQSGTLVTEESVDDNLTDNEDNDKVCENLEEEISAEAEESLLNMEDNNGEELEPISDHKPDIVDEAPDTPECSNSVVDVEAPPTEVESENNVPISDMGTSEQENEGLDFSAINEEAVADDEESGTSHLLEGGDESSQDKTKSIEDETMDDSNPAVTSHATSEDLDEPKEENNEENQPDNDRTERISEKADDSEFRNNEDNCEQPCPEISREVDNTDSDQVVIPDSECKSVTSISDAAEIQNDFRKLEDVPDDGSGEDLKNDDDVITENNPEISYLVNNESVQDSGNNVELDNETQEDTAQDSIDTDDVKTKNNPEISYSVNNESVQDSGNNVANETQEDTAQDSIDTDVANTENENNDVNDDTTSENIENLELEKKENSPIEIEHANTPKSVAGETQSEQMNLEENKEQNSEEVMEKDGKGENHDIVKESGIEASNDTVESSTDKVNDVAKDVETVSPPELQKQSMDNESSLDSETESIESNKLQKDNIEDLADNEEVMEIADSSAIESTNTQTAEEMIESDPLETKNEEAKPPDEVKDTESKDTEQSMEVDDDDMPVPTNEEHTNTDGELMDLTESPTPQPKDIKDGGKTEESSEPGGADPFETTLVETKKEIPEPFGLYTSMDSTEAPHLEPEAGADKLTEEAVVSKTNEEESVDVPPRKDPIGFGESVSNTNESVKQEDTNEDVSSIKIVGVTSAVWKDDDGKTGSGLKIASVCGSVNVTPKLDEKISDVKQSAIVKTETKMGSTEKGETKKSEDDDAMALKDDKKPAPKPKSSKLHKCIVCAKFGKCKYNIVRNGDIKHLCDDACFKQFRSSPTTFLKQAETEKTTSAPEAPVKNGTQPAVTTPPATANSKVALTTMLQNKQVGEAYKTCAVCQLMNVRTTKPFLNWQDLDYCGEDCLGKFQGNLSKTCSYCSSDIHQSNKAKFCCRIGSDVKHFCSQTCNTEFVKRIKTCAFCNKDLKMESDSFMAPVGNQGMFKDFCSQPCLLKYEDKNEKEAAASATLLQELKTISTPKGNFPCSVCGKNGPVKHELLFEKKNHRLCSDPCYSAFQYANKLTLNACDNCGTNCFNEGQAPNFVQFEGKQKRFCSFMCVNTFRNKKKKPTPCAWCGTKKNNFDMIERVDSTNKFQLFCSLNCLSLYRVNLQATSNQAVLCDQCKKFVPAQYHLTMSDASVRNFCSYGCVMQFQSQFQTPTSSKVPPLAPKQQGTPQAPTQPITTTRSGRVVSRGTKQQAYVDQLQEQQIRKEVVNNSKATKTNQDGFVPIISNMVSLSPKVTQQQINIKSPANVTVTDQQSGMKTITTSTSANQTVQQQIVIQPPPPKAVKNKSTLCKPFVQTKATACRPHTQTKQMQTEGKPEPEKIFIPVPVPIYCPTPLSMYSMPTPILIPVPVPIPVPVFIPTTKKSASSILKQIKEIQEKIPADPLEAELLMMAEAVAGKGEESSSDSDNDDTEVPVAPTKEVTPAANGGDLGEDMLQMALRMASEMSDEPVMDLENSLEPVAVNTERPPQPSPGINMGEEAEDEEEFVPTTRTRRGRGSTKRQTRTTQKRNTKRQRTESQPQPAFEERSPTPPSVQVRPPDANFHLKYTYGVNAFKHWVSQKNAQIETTTKPGSSRPPKPFKTDILQCTADELNHALCLFVKEVRKPNGEEYAVDSIYYLCLGIQQYLFESGRIDNVFTDMYYERFTECLNELLCRYEPKLNQAGQLVCRIEEEHLWESKQLGAHSPHVLLNTLVYFNTKFFMLKTSEDHLKLSFTHIMKHWKKTASGRGSGTGPNLGRSVYLRYYCPTPQTKENAQKKKKEEMPVYEQTENLDNPLRCPVKLYEFYLSKCPESIKNRNDTFYLVPERSCVPDSPVWYSTAMLGIDAMAKMLNRIRLVREIQEAHLHTQPIYI